MCRRNSRRLGSVKRRASARPLRKVVRLAPEDCKFPNEYHKQPDKPYRYPKHNKHNDLEGYVICVQVEAGRTGEGRMGAPYAVGQHADEPQDCGSCVDGLRLTKRFVHLNHNAGDKWPPTRHGHGPRD